MVDSSTHLNKLLYVAEKVWPDKNWVLHKGLVFESSRETSEPTFGGCYYCEPHKATERGKAQLMDIVFAIASSEKDFDAYELIACLSDGNAEAIINLAAEVLE